MSTLRVYWDGSRYITCEVLYAGKGRMPHESGDGWTQCGNRLLEAAPGNGDWISQAESRKQPHGRAWNTRRSRAFVRRSPVGGA